MLQRTCAVKIMAIKGGIPHHLKLAEGRGPRRLKWPVSSSSFYGPGGILHCTCHKPMYLASFATLLLAFN